MRNLLISYAKAVCLTGLLLLAGCSDKDKDKAKQQPVPFINQDRFGRYDSIGNLGGKPVSIPGGVVLHWVRYIGDPGDFDASRKAQKYKRPPITYQLPIESFGFMYRLTDGAVLSKKEKTDIDFMHDNKTLIPRGEPFPWGHTIVYNLYKTSMPTDFNKAFEENLQLTRKIDKFEYFEQSEKKYGLTYFKANNGIDPFTNQPWQDDISSPDIFIYKNLKGKIKTYIQCDCIGQVQFCKHRFYLKSLPILIYISYNRNYLSFWEQTEKNIDYILNSWVVSNDGRLIKKQAGKFN
ncbi:hypothetical protein BHC43_02055 [Snodgrassella alvi]|uniref:hypothetical protein n=1 Tax=Snodgrassella alvi TaxID=1196083 RepID=UPI000C1ED7F9|nr:hypothetical protein [Snodgrassella alvi]PIT41054.1 hypothetical protein BHC43_02055 [Snodgrassella alvi]